jgi:DNA-directed RNA polymerase subunit RPC12/RpoP
MGTLRVCKTCDKQFEVTLGKHKICEDCRSK